MNENQGEKKIIRIDEAEVSNLLDRKVRESVEETLSELNKKLYARIDKWRNRPIEGEHPYVYMDGICLKRTWGGRVKNVSVLVAVGVNSGGYREILGVSEGPKEDKSGWESFLSSLKQRGLKGVRLIVSDKCMGLVESAGEYYPDADWQWCKMHFYRDVWKDVPSTKMKEVTAMLKAVHAQEDYEAALKKSVDVVAKLEAMKLPKAAKQVEETVHETLSYMHYPREHWRSIATNNPLERLMREIRRRTRVVGSFPDGESEVMLAAARLRHISGTKWGARRYMDMSRLKDHDLETGSQEEAI